MNIPTAKAMRTAGWLVAAAMAGQLACQPARATLGEDASTTENDRAHMKAQLRTTSIAGYAVHEIQSPTGTVVREYINDAGKVFAVAWEGPLLPDFRQTLGRYFPEYSSEASSPRVGRRHLAIDHSDFVVRSSGHMRAFRGIAYVPSMLPANFSADEIK